MYCFIVFLDLCDLVGLVSGKNNRIPCAFFTTKGRGIFEICSSTNSEVILLEDLSLSPNQGTPKPLVISL